VFTHPGIKFTFAATSVTLKVILSPPVEEEALFKGTFEALSRGLAVALFPEGTSYTEPRIMRVKDGAAWAALEYTKWIKDNNIKADPNVLVIPVVIVYTNKSKYRSNVIVEFGRPISMDAY
jgi:glycerol-3-phosphate O-acyltransferase / dihydroxyacetone phosphate acyltransferase